MTTSSLSLSHSLTHIFCCPKVGVPSRTEVAEYRDLGSQVNELVGRINGNYGTLEYSPVHYINQSISQVRIRAKR